MVDIFISYAREDLGRVESLAAALAKRGWSIWRDSAIPAGRAWREAIREGLESARAVVVLWSKASVVSRYVQDEAEHGLQREILIPILIDEVNPPFGFGSIQAANLVGWTPDLPSQAFKKLIADISKICPPSGNVEQVGRIEETGADRTRELNDIRQGVGYFKELVDQVQSSANKQRKYWTAIRAINQAAITTNSYLRDIREGGEPDKAKERTLSELWFKATEAIQPVNPELADKCMIKGQCWSDPRLFNSKEYENISLSIECMFSETRKILHEMPGE
jgi:hypothetical protein